MLCFLCFLFSLFFLSCDCYCCFCCCCYCCCLLLLVLLLCPFRYPTKLRCTLCEGSSSKFLCWDVRETSFASGPTIPNNQNNYDTVLALTKQNHQCSVVKHAIFQSSIHVGVFECRCTVVHIISTSFHFEDQRLTNSSDFIHEYVVDIMIPSNIIFADPRVWWNSHDWYSTMVNHSFWMVVLLKPGLFKCFHAGGRLQFV